MRSFRRALLILAAAAPLMPPAHGIEPAEILARIRTPTLSVDSAVIVENLELDMGMAVLDLQQGTLIPVEETDGRTTEIVFVGRGRFVIEPPDAIEAGQLDLFTGQESLDTSITEAILVFGDASVPATLLRRTAAAIQPAVTRRAEELFKEWVEGPQRKWFGADAALFAAALSDSAFQGSFAALCRSEELGDFYYQLDPTVTEQVSINQFVPAEIGDHLTDRIRKYIRKQRRHGRFIEFSVDELGDWDTWFSSSLRTATGDLSPGSPGFEPDHYRVELTIDSDRKAVGRA